MVKPHTQPLFHSKDTLSSNQLVHLFFSEINQIHQPYCNKIVRLKMLAEIAATNTLNPSMPLYCMCFGIS